MLDNALLRISGSFLLLTWATSLPERNFSKDWSNLVCAKWSFKLLVELPNQPLEPAVNGDAEYSLLVAENESKCEAFSVGNMAVFLYVWCETKVEWCCVSSLFLSILPFVKCPLFLCFVFFILNILFIFRERGWEGEREGEKHQCAVASHMPPTGGLACNPGMCPDWEWNPRPCGSEACTQSTELHQLGSALYSELILI